MLKLLSEGGLLTCDPKQIATTDWEISFSFRDTAGIENNPKSLRQRLVHDLQFNAPCSNHNAGKSPATPWPFIH